MKMVVFGATGGIGGQVVAQALAAGHQVRAFVRDPAKANLPDQMEVVAGNITDADRVTQAIAGTDAVVWAIGASRNSAEDVTIAETGARNVVAAMTSQGVRRLVAVSGAGITVVGERKPISGRLMSLIVRVAARHVYEAKRREYEIFRAADLDWTLVRPPRVTPGEPTGRVVVGPDLASLAVTQGDVAAAMVGVLEDQSTFHRTPFVSSSRT